MSNLEQADPRIPVTGRQPGTWDFFETTLVVLISYGAFMLVGGYTVAFALRAYGSINALSPKELRAAWLGLQGSWQGLYYIAATMPAIAVLWAATRMAGRGFAEYLALNWPTWREALLAFGIMALVIWGEGFVAHIVGERSQLTASDFAVGGPGGLLIMLIGTCIAVPIAEEFIVRGFLFRGWSESFLGPRGAIVLTSAVWAMNHTQYDWFGRLNIFVMGLALCHFRWRSGSTWLTVMIHSTLNTLLFIKMGPYV
jgi:CAAX protease family protein